MKKNKIILLFFIIISSQCSFSKTRILLSAALTDAYFEFRKEQYIGSLHLLQGYGYKDVYIVEALKKTGPTFLNDYTPNVFYATTNNPNFRNNGINEAMTLLEASYFFNFDPDDIIVKLTGRYHLISDSLIKLIENNPDVDVFAKFTDIGNIYTLCFAMRCKYFQEMYSGMNYELMERNWILVEHEAGNYIKRKLNAGIFKAMHVDKLGIRANLYGSSTAPGTPEIINYY